MNESIKDSDYMKKMTVVNPTTITPTAPVIPPNVNIDLYKASSLLWGQKSESKLADYKYGWQLGKFGTGRINTTNNFLAKISECIIAMITRECSKSNQSSESFSLQFKILESILLTLSKELDAKKLKDYEVASIMATLHGFIDSIVDNNEQAKG